MFSLKSLNTPNLKRDRVMVLVGGVFIHLVLGTYYLWGAILLYVASYLRSYDNTVDMSMLVGVSPYSGLGMNIGMMFGLQIAEKIGYRLTIGLGILFTSLSCFCASFTTGYYPFLFTYGIFGGLCVGVVYLIPVVCGWKLFPKNRGLVSGVTIGAFGFGAFIFNFVALAIVNPNNEDATNTVGEYSYFGPDVYENVPKMFRILGICYCALGMIGVFIIRVPKQASKNQSKKISDASEYENQEQAQSQEEESLLPAEEQQGGGCTSVKAGVFSYTFAALFMMAFFGSFFGVFMATNYKVYGIIGIPDDSFLTVVGSMGSVSNGCTRALWAILFDKFGFKRVYGGLLILQAALAGTLSLISDYKALYLIWYALIMSCEGGHFAILPSVSVKVFGMRLGPKIYGFLFWTFAVGSFSVYFMTQYGLPAIGWNAIFYVALGGTAFSFLVNLTFKEKLLNK